MDPVSIGIGLALMIASYLITSSMAQGTKQQPNKPAAMADFEFPQFEEGTAEAVIFGDVWMQDMMVLYYGDFQVDPIYQNAPGGKK